MTFHLRMRSSFILPAVLCACGFTAQAQQIAPNGQAVPPGTQNRHPGAATPCVTNDPNTMPSAPNESNCTAFAPGFSTPSTNAPPPDRADRRVTSIVRVEGVVSQQAPLDGQDVSQVGSATMVRARQQRLGDCFHAGKDWSNRANAPTSTTCVDRKGEVVAYQECRPKSGETPMTCTVARPQDTKEQENAGIR